MYIEISKKVTKTKVYEYILLRKSIRDKQTGKIKKVTLANLINEPIEQVMTIVNAFKGKTTISTQDLGQGKTIGLSLIIIFIMNMPGMLKAIENTFEAKIAILLIAARIKLLGDTKTTTVNITSTYIPKVNQNLQNLFKIMDFTIPNKVDYQM